MTMTEGTQSYAYLDVNPVIMTSDNKIILTKRIDKVLEGGKWHFPGGRVLSGERIESALRRHAKRKTGLDITLHRASLVKDLIGVYDDPKRDPRGHIIALAYLCRVVGGKIKPGYNVSEVVEFDEDRLKGVEIGFDHKQIALDSFKHLKNSI